MYTQYIIKRKIYELYMNIISNFLDVSFNLYNNNINNFCNFIIILYTKSIIH